MQWITNDKTNTLIDGNTVHVVVNEQDDNYVAYASSNLETIGTYNSLSDAKLSSLGYLKHKHSSNHKSIAVIGVGTAGLLSLSHMLAFTDDDTIITSIHDPSTPILGIGESTTAHIPENLFKGTGFNLMQDANELDATVKLGVKYKGFREHEFDSLIIPPYTAFHFNNFKLKEFCFKRFEQKWQDKFKTLHGKVKSLINSTNFVTVVYEDDSVDAFDYVMDCGGFPKDFTEYNMSTVIPVNHCLVNMVPEPGTWNWTWHVAHRNGWMFGIPLQTRQGWGYLYNDEITSKEDAMQDIAERFNTTPDKLQLREFTFNRYYAKSFLEGRIIKNGNRALFFEPMEALSGYFYDQVNRYFISFLRDEMTKYQVNSHLQEYAQCVESFIAYVYQGGSTYDSEFWKIAQNNAKQHLKNNNYISHIMNNMRNTPVSKRSNGYVFIPFQDINWRHFDKNLGYNEL